MDIPAPLRRFARIFIDHGFQCFVVGGAIRNSMIGRPLNDFDIATDALPNQVQRLFRRTIPTGIRHGTVTVLFGGTSFEVTTFRAEAEYSDGRRPDYVSYASTISEDLARRDFTINAMAYDLAHDTLLDPYGGRKDIEQRRIRAIGDAAKRFAEDGLRPLRACRLATQLEFALDPATETAMRRCRSVVSRIAAERIRDELEKILTAKVPSRGVDLLERNGLLELTVPELHDCIGTGGDVYFHLLQTCDACPQSSLVLRLAGLLHDLGSPGIAGTDTSENIARRIMNRLKFSRNLIDTACYLIRNHGYRLDSSASESDVRRFVSRVGASYVHDLIVLQRADRCGCPSTPQNLLSFPELARRIDIILAGGAALTVADLQITGHDIMQSLSIKPGREVGRILEDLLDAVLDDPELNRGEPLLSMARRLYHTRATGN